MSQSYFEDLTIEKMVFTEKPLAKGFYEGCTFSGCDFANADISDTNFTDCAFKDCNLSLAKIVKTTFNHVHFTGCKMLGLHFDECSKMIFSVQFTSCVLNLSSFFRLNMKKTTFSSCSLHEVDFTETDLAGASFDDCDLAGAIFDGTNIEKADFRKAINYTLDPDKNKVKKARFAVAGLAGLLGKHNLDIH